VLHPVPLKDLQRPVITAQGYGDLERPARRGEELVQPVVEAEVLDGAVELEQG
jgi:hypothetical protein